jgi:peptide deformylase
MAVLKIRKYGDPVLRRRAEPVGEITPKIRSIIADMIDTMYAEGRGAQTLVDPVITARGGEATAEEGCLSIPGVFAPVTRSVWVKIEAHDADGKPLSIEARGLRARVFQHELDHLDGILFIDHLDPVTRDRIKRKIKKEGLREDAARHAFAL